MSVRTPLLFPETKDLLKDPAENSNALILAKISKTSGLYHLRKTLQTERVSNRASERITNSQCTGSVKHYESAFGKSITWCSRREVCPTRCDIS